MLGDASAVLAILAPATTLLRTPLTHLTSASFQRAVRIADDRQLGLVDQRIGRRGFGI